MTTADPKYPTPGTRFRHYKGGDYAVLGVGMHSETGEVGVFYLSINFRSMHFRPIDEWNKRVDRTKIPEGQTDLRFTYIGPCDLTKLI
jgi:hypothetical protein